MNDKIIQDTKQLLKIAVMTQDLLEGFDVPVVKMLSVIIKDRVEAYLARLDEAEGEDKMNVVVSAAIVIGRLYAVQTDIFLFAVKKTATKAEVMLEFQKVGKLLKDASSAVMDYLKKEVDK